MIFDGVREFLSKYNIVGEDLERPWGGFYCIDDTQVTSFIQDFFPSIHIDATHPISPKILIIAPEQKLSWQYHHRREEVWSIVKGPVGVVRSNNNEPGLLQTHESGDLIHIGCEERHRLIGLEDVAIVAELWKHVNPDYLSDETDIVRLKDEYGR